MQGNMGILPFVESGKVKIILWHEFVFVVIYGE